MRLAVAAMVAALAPLQAGPARAETARAATPPLPPVPPAVVAPAIGPKPGPPYESELTRLAELLGTLTFLRDLCGAGDGAAWRGKMTALMEAEGDGGDRTARLAGSYNRGLRDYRLTYRTCTPAAQAAIDRALAEGARISQDLSARFGLD